MPLPPLQSAPHLSEADVSQQVKDFLRAKGWRIIRHQRAVVPGQFQSGEPGIPDLQAIYYLNQVRAGLTVTCWLEVKGPRDKRVCSCLWRAMAKRKGKCTVCLQADWRARERSRGAYVTVVNNLVDFEVIYNAVFGWLHSGAVPGQIVMELQ